MAENTKIEWADHSWSPWRGCTKVSPGCLNCYAETLSKRNPTVLGSWGKGANRVLAKNWGDPMRWNAKVDKIQKDGEDLGIKDWKAGRPMVFPSLCDWLDDEVSPAWLAEFLALINLTPNLDWLLLTKRPESWRKRIDDAALASTPFHHRWLVEWLNGTPPQNVWFGVSVEDQTRANERIPLLLEIPARVRWLSVEPLIGPVGLGSFAFGGFAHSPNCENEHCSISGGVEDCCGVEIPAINWVVVGGESGPGARPCNVSWIQDIVRECQSASVPVFVKQLGARPVEDIYGDGGSYVGFNRVAGIRHPKGGDPAEWPDDLRVREYPRT